MSTYPTQLDLLSFNSDTWDRSILSSPEAAGESPLRCANLIIPRLYLSDLTTARNEETLRNLGITHIVSVIENAPAFPESMAHIQKLHIKSVDVSGDNLLQHMPTTTAFIHAALDDKPNNVVLVHCAQGISRSATMVCAYLIATTEMIASETIEFVRTKRTFICPNVGFRTQLYEYSTTFYGKGQKNGLHRQKVSNGIADRIKRLKGLMP